MRALPRATACMMRLVAYIERKPLKLVVSGLTHQTSYPLLYRIEEAPSMHFVVPKLAKGKVLGAQEGWLLVVNPMLLRVLSLATLCLCFLDDLSEILPELLCCLFRRGAAREQGVELFGYRQRHI